MIDRVCTVEALEVGSRGSNYGRLQKPGVQ